MAPRPGYLSIQTMCEDIARGIGTAGGLLPQLARSPVGTLAVKGAQVAIDFELTSEARERRAGVGADVPAFGAKTATLFGGLVSSEAASRALNRARITLEIVAVVDAPPRVPDEKPDDKPVAGPPGVAVPDAVAVRDRLARLGPLIARAGLPVDRRAALEAILKAAYEDLAAGRLADAAEKAKAIETAQGGR